MTPYYQDDHVTLYHGDARDIGPALTADVLVTDPPYGVSFKGKVTKHTGAGGGYLGDDDPDVGPEVVRNALQRVKRGVVFPGTRRLHAYPEPADIGCVFCPSGAGIGRWGFTMYHPVLFYGTRPGPVRPSSIESFDTAGVDGRGHPCPKPLRWMTWAVSMGAAAGDVVLDPFAGSGTTLVAAKGMGHRAIGIEREERYCEIVAKRLGQEVLGLVA